MRKITCTCDRCEKPIEGGIVYRLTCYAEKVDPEMSESAEMSREIWEQNSIRNKKRRGKKLEKWEEEYYNENKDRIDFKKTYSAEEKAVLDRFTKWLQGGD